MTDVDEDAIWDPEADAPIRLSQHVKGQVRSDYVAVIEFDRAPTNFFDLEIIAAIADAAEEVAQQGSRAIVLTSVGRIFCAGADFEEAGTELAPSFLYEEAVRLFRQPLPLVAAVQGAAIGGGMGLALAADLRVASPEARFSVNFARIGIHPGFGLSVTLPRVVGEQCAMDLLYTGRRINGQEAADIGLVDRLSIKGHVRREALALALDVAQSAPLAVASIRQTLRGTLADQVAAAVVHECKEQMMLFGTADFAEGVASVNERRVGRFMGR